MRRIRSSMLCMALVITAGGARAQAIGTTTANPGVAAQRGLLENTRTDAQFMKPAPAPSTLVPSDAVESAGSADPAGPGARRPGTPTVFVSRIRVEGNTLLPASEVAAAITPYVQREVSFEDLQKMARELRQLYRNRGYFVAKVVIPPQDIGPAPLKVVVQEGKIGEVKVVGNKHYSSEFVQRMFRPAAKDGYVRSGPLVKSLMTMNEMPDLAVRSTLAPGAKEGTADVILKVEDKSPVHAYLDVNNYGNRLVGRNRTTVGASVGNTLFDGDDLRLSAGFPFPSRSNPFYQAGYSVPVGDEGSRIAFQFAQAKTRVSEELDALGINGQADIYDLRFLHPVERTVDRSRNLTFGLTLKTIENFALEDVLTSKDALRIASVGYNEVATHDDTRTMKSIVVSHGLGTALNGNANENALSSRAGAGNSFTKVNADVVSITQLDAKNSLILRGSGQATTDPLVVAELFSVGGPDSVRAYIPGEFLGDKGIFGSIELHHSVFEGLAKKNIRTQLVGFADHGYAQVLRPGPLELDERHLTAVGTGVRASFGENTSFRLDAAYPLNTGRNADGDTVRVYGQLASKY